MSRVELKSAAKEQIKGQIGTLFVIMLIVAVISGAINLIPGVGSVASFVLSAAFSLSFALIFLGLANGVAPEVKDVFKGFNDLWSAIKAIFFVGLFTALWSLLLYIPGIIKAISYSQTMFILAENPGMPAREAIKRSMEMMNGHKMEYFVLQLSFILWYLLGAITFGIAYIYVIPYVNATNANFYNSIKPVEVEVDAAEAPVVE